MKDEANLPINYEKGNHVQIIYSNLAVLIFIVKNIMFFISQNDSWIVVFAKELMRRQLFVVAFTVSINYSTILHVYKCTLQTTSFLPQNLIKVEQVM